jgi:aldose 1-epimerase
LFRDGCWTALSLPGGNVREGWGTEVVTYGAGVTRLLAPDRDGHLADVVLGFDSLPAYSSQPGYFGSVVGRVAGQITNARFSLDGELRSAAVSGTKRWYGTSGAGSSMWSGFAGK